MANSTCEIVEIRFDVRDAQITHCYVLVMASYDAPIGVQGWHYKAFPARIPVSEILTPAHFEDHLLWPLKAPEKGDWYMTINADRDVPPETAEALAVMGQLVADQYAEQDKGSAIEDTDLTEVSLKAALESFARLQSEHSDLIERERLLESGLRSIPWEAIETLTYESPTGNSQKYIMAMATVADWILSSKPRIANMLP